MSYDGESVGARMLSSWGGEEEPELEDRNDRIFFFLMTKKNPIGKRGVSSCEEPKQGWEGRGWKKNVLGSRYENHWKIY